MASMWCITDAFIAGNAPAMTPDKIKITKARTATFISISACFIIVTLRALSSNQFILSRIAAPDINPMIPEIKVRIT